MCVSLRQVVLTPARVALRVVEVWEELVDREEAAPEGRRRGEQPARLAPDASCLPPGQLCHYLPHGTCSPGGAADRIRPAVRGAVAKGVRGAVRLKTKH